MEKNYVAGAYHPALMELCQSRIMLERMTDALNGVDGSRIRGFAVHPSELSKAIGQKQCNLIALRGRVSDAVITACSDVPVGRIRLIYRQ